MDGKEQAKRTWGASPTGSTSAAGYEPGTRAFFDKARHFRDTVEQPWLDEVVPFAASEGRSVLEIGFGPGYDALRFLQSGANYTGVDLTPENVVRATKHLSFFGFNADLREADAESLPFADKSFDIVYSNGVLHHVPDFEMAVSEVNRVLRDRGEFYVLLYHKFSVFYIISVLAVHFMTLKFLKQSVRERMARVEYSTAEAAPIVSVYSRGQLSAILKKNGFEVIYIKVRKLTWHDFPGASLLGGLYKRVPQRLYDRVGERFGWYVIAAGRKIAKKKPESPT